jgi:cytoskeletal protein CcmA (bactofilin family)
MFFWGRYTQWAPLRKPDYSWVFCIARRALLLDQTLRGGGHDMWKRDESVKPTSQPTPAAPVAPTQQASVPAPQPEPRRIERDMVNIGKSVVIKGELAGSEDLTIEGHVEGKIELKDHVLTIGPNGKIRAQVFAKSVIVLGEVNGNVTASEKVDIRDGGSVDGDIISPRVAIAEGAHFRGSVDMQRKGAAQPQAAPSQKAQNQQAAQPQPQVAAR